MILAVPHFEHPTVSGLAGAAAIGIVLGWIASRTLIKTKASVASASAVIALIIGGTVTGVFGDAEGSLFGLYGVGVLVGFALYPIGFGVLNGNQELKKVLSRRGENPQSGDTGGTVGR